MSNIETEKSELNRLLEAFPTERDPVQKTALLQQAEARLAQFRTLPGVSQSKELDAAKRDRNTDTVMPGLPTPTPAEATGEPEALPTQTPPPEPTQFVLLNNGDHVQILRVADDHYFVQVVTNSADNNAATVIGKQGWILRAIVDGTGQ